MDRRIGYRWVTYGCHGLLYRWIIDESHMGVTDCVIDESHVRQTLLHESQMRLWMGYKWIVSGSQISHKCVMHESQMRHTWLPFRIQQFPLSSPNLPFPDPVATLQLRKIIVIFDQSEESNPILSLTTFLWHVASCLVFMCYSDLYNDPDTYIFVSYLQFSREKKNKHFFI